MTVSQSHDPTYMTKLSCMAASIAADTDCTNITQDAYVRWHKPQDQEAVEMLQQLGRVARAACPQREVSSADVSAALRQYSQITGMAAAQLMVKE